MPDTQQSLTALDFLSGASSVATIAALIYAGYQTYRARIAASAAAVIQVHALITNRFFSPNFMKDRSEWTTLLNELEISCALYFDKQFGGMTGKLVTDFIDQILLIIENDEDFRDHLEKQINTPDTFECLARYHSERKTRLKNNASR